jgi:preprotein translocase subunit SecF
VGLASRLYQGEVNLDFVGKRKIWYAVSGLLMVLCIASIALRGFNFGIEFAGGSSFRVPAKAGVSQADARSAVDSTGHTVESAQTAGSGNSKTYIIKTAELTTKQSTAVKNALVKRLHLKAGDVSTDQVSSSWGQQVTKQALIGLIAFLAAVSVYLALRYEFKMALAAMVALAHDLALAAGVYSIVGFEVTPSTVVGLLTILGFSLYDTVVVFDKVAENVKGIEQGKRSTYAESANLALNQTLMRSINTSVIGLLPVAGLLFVGAGLLGAGTLKDLALVLFVGMLSGAYSSIFLATPVLVDMKEREPKYRALAHRVQARRREEARKAERAATVALDKPSGSGGDEGEAAGEAGDGEPVEVGAASGPYTAPRVGARPGGNRPAGKRKPAGRKPGTKRKR